MMRWSAVSVGLVALAATVGCRNEAPPVEQPARPDGGLGILTTRPMEPGELPAPGDGAAGDVQVPAVPGDACPDGPAWTGITRCAEGGYLFAAGKTSGIASTDLARSTAANRARALLASADPLELTQPRTLERVEILEHARCGEAMYALARMYLPVDAQVAPCAPGSTTLAAGDGNDDAKRCPAWTNRGVWIEGTDLIAVASARAGNPMLAEKMARNRAASEVARFPSVTVANKGGAVEVSSSGMHRLVPGESERAECDGFVYVKVRHSLTSP